jgi:hypothetical protein
MEKIKDYRIHTNIHGGGWKDKYDLRDKIRRLMLRLRANSASQDVINASREMDDLIQEMKQSIRYRDTLISQYENEKEIQNKIIQERKEVLSKAIKEHGFMKNKQQQKVEDTLKNAIQYHKKIHDELKNSRDREYTKKKELKNQLVELERIARKRDSFTGTQSRLHDEAYAYPIDEGEVMSVHPLNPKEILESASESSIPVHIGDNESQAEKIVKFNERYDTLTSGLRQLVESKNVYNSNLIQELNLLFRLIMSSTGSMNNKNQYDSINKLSKLQKIYRKSKNLPEEVIDKIFTTGTVHSYPDVELQRLEDIIGTLQSEIQNYEYIIAHEADQDRVDDATERRNKAREDIQRLNREKEKIQGSGKPKRQLKGYKINI